MSLQLRANIPAGYMSFDAYHNPGRQQADIAAINLLRNLSDKPPFGEAELLNYIDQHAVVTIYQNGPKNRMRWIAGYVVASRSEFAGNVKVRDLFVSECHRGRGIAEYMLAELIENAPIQYRRGYELRNYGSQLQLDTTLYVLPGMHINTNINVLGEDRERNVLQQYCSRTWDGIHSQSRSSAVYHQIIEAGSPIQNAESTLTDPRVTIDGKRYDNILLGAVALLNPDA